MDWEAGDVKIVPKPVMQECLDTALSRASDEAKTRFAALASGDAVVRSDSVGGNGNGDDADRRQAGKTIVVGSLAATLFPIDALERITTHGDRPVDSKLITAHEAIAETLAGMYLTSQPELLGGLVAHHADKLLKLLGRPMASADRQRLEGIAVGSHAQAGMLAFHVRDQSGARRYFAVAKDVADDAANGTLRAQALTVASVLHSPILTGGRRGDSQRAVTLMDQAVDHAWRADPATGAYAHLWRGLQLAAAGDERGLFESLEVFERLSEPHGRLESRGFFASYLAMTPERVTRNRGTGLVLIGRAEEAVEALKDLLGPADPRSSVLTLADLAAAHVLQGEPEQACAELERALDLALEAGYVMGVERILGVRARFPVTWAPLPCVQALDERLRLLTT